MPGWMNEPQAEIKIAGRNITNIRYADENESESEVAQSCLTLFDLWTIACQVPLSMRFSRQKQWSGLPFPSPGDHPKSGIESASPALQAHSLPSEPCGKPNQICR